MYVSAIDSTNPRAGRPANSKRLRIRVCSRTRNLTLPAADNQRAHPARIGESEHVIFEHQLADVQNLLATPDDERDYEAACTAYQAQLDEWIERGKHEGGQAKRFTESTYPGSVAAEWWRMFRRPMPPLTKLEVVEHMPSPAEELLERQSAKPSESPLDAEAFAAAMAKALAPLIERGGGKRS